MAMRCTHASAGASGFQRGQARKARRYASCTQSSAAARSRRIVTSVPKRRGYVSSYNRSKSSGTPGRYSLSTLVEDYLSLASFRRGPGSPRFAPPLPRLLGAGPARSRAPERAARARAPLSLTSPVLVLRGVSPQAAALTHGSGEDVFVVGHQVRDLVLQPAERRRMARSPAARAEEEISGSGVGPDRIGPGRGRHSGVVT